MHDYLRVLRILTPYKGRLTLLALCIVMASVLSSVGITFISPLLRILFSDEPIRVEQTLPAEGEEVAEEGPGATGIPLPAAVEEWKESGARWLRARLYRGDRQEMLVRVCLWLLVLYGLKNLFAFLQAALRVQLEHLAIYHIRHRLYEAIQNQPMGFFTGERTGYLMSRVIIDVDMMRGAIVGSITQFLSNGLMVLIAMVIVLLVSWQLSLATLLIVPPNMLLVAVLSRKLRKGSHRVQEEMGEAAAALQEGIAGVRILKLFDVGGEESGRFSRSNLRYYRAYVKLKVLEALSSPVSEILGVLTAVLILGFGGHLVLSGRLRADMLFMFLGVMLWVIGPIKNLIKVNSTLQQSLAAARRVFQILDTPTEADLDAGRRDVDGVHEALRFEGVSFEYHRETPVLREVELSVGAGEVVALVGPSGAGKSTLVDLVPRFYTPTRGRVTLDGVDLQDIHLGTLRGLVGMVTQEVILFHDTVAANIAFGSPKATREEIEAAARTANAHEFIAQLSSGYDTVIGERGLQLSGGQRQRLAIARAVLRNPPILILDEATSALDTESEKQVQEAMERLMVGRTTLVIAHRLSTVTRADRIVVMEGGRIVEAGSHAQLLARGGSYRRLYELQFEHDGPDAGPPAQLAG